MQWADVTIYLWLLVPLAIYCVVAVAVQVLANRIPLIKTIKLALHLIALGLCMHLAVVLYLPDKWGKSLQPYSAALLIFAALVLLIQAVEALAIGYVMGTLQKRKIPIVLRKAILLMACFIVAMVILNAYLHLDVTSLVATSAVLSFVVGLASQDLLGSILGGIVLAVERPIGKDNWVVIDGMEGRVVDVTWRRTRIETRDGDFVLVPNSSVMKNTIVNFTMPDRRHRLRIVVGVDYRHPPNQVKEAILSAARRCSEVIDSPAPSVFLQDFDDSAITYRLNAWIDGLAGLERVGDEVRTHIWYEFKRQGIVIPWPIVTLNRPSSREDPEAAVAEHVRRVTPHLAASEIFAGVPRETLAHLARRMKASTYGAGEVLFNEGDEGSSFYLIMSGRASVIAQVEGGAQTRLATLGPGACFGEMSLLLDQKRTATVRLEEDSELLEADRAMFKELIGEHPDFLDFLTNMVAERQKGNRELMDSLAGTGPVEPQSRLRAVLGRIKSVLGL